MSIQKIEMIYAGYCVNDEKRMFRGASHKKVEFPAACVLLKHSERGYVMFDTGYSRENENIGGLTGFLYKKLNPDYIDKETELVSILKKKGIDESEIGTVIVSHVHPDHVGGLKAFGSASFVISEEAYGVYAKPSIKSLVFRNLFPEDFSRRAVRIKADRFYSELFPRTYDVFGDESALMVPIEGHSKGQMGLYLPNERLFFAADACWREEYFGRTNEMRSFPRFLQNSFREYTETQNWLSEVCKSGIKVIYSHNAPLENGELK